MCDPNHEHKIVICHFNRNEMNHQKAVIELLVSNLDIHTNEGWCVVICTKLLP